MENVSGKFQDFCMQILLVLVNDKFKLIYENNIYMSCRRKNEGTGSKKI